MQHLIQLKNTYLILVTGILLGLFSPASCKQINPNSEADLTAIKQTQYNEPNIITAADQTEEYLPILREKNIAVVANQTSVISKKNSGYTHLIDSLLALDIKIQRVFAPEHGFRGEVDAGEQVSDDKDKKTGLSLISLYGKNKKPSKHQLRDVDLVLFDIQDVGVRFYTYISTLTYIMEACAELKIPVLILDRPNPNGHYVDGPMLDSAYKSFVGMHEIPLVYGMTIGEYGSMVNGEKWMANKISCDLSVISLKNYSHDLPYSLPIRPSPNLPNDQAINLYPSLGFFEGTIINAGRGTEFQFQRYGAPFFPESLFNYTPTPNFGAKNPKFKGEKCYGVDLSQVPKLSKVNLEWLIDAYNKTPKDKEFFGETFTIHAGNEELRKKIENGLSADEIRRSWQPAIDKFQLIRQQYLIYP